MRKKLSDLGSRTRNSRLQRKRRKRTERQFEETKNIMKHNDLRNRLFGFHYVAPELHPELMPNGTLVKFNVVRSCFFTNTERVSLADIYSGHHKHATIFQNFLNDSNPVVCNVKFELEDDKNCNVLKNVDSPNPLHLVETDYGNQGLYASLEEPYKTEFVS